MGTETDINREYRPWQEDGIQFLSGDWEIWRAENEGTYYYTIDGTPGRGAVDAMSLIDWHMAKLIEYEELTPWTSSIVFKTGDWEIMRDLFASGGANKYKKYYVMTSSGIKKVNMYGLLSLDIATADDATEQEILRVASDTIRGDESSRPWPSDAIILTPLPGVTIKRASAEGFYIYTKGYLNKTVKADSLIDSGNASPLRPVGLASLSFVQDLTRAQFEAEFGGFWGHDAPSTIGSLREVVVLWRELGAQNSERGSAIVEKYKQLVDPIQKVTKSAIDCMECVTDLVGEVKAFDADINYIIPLRDKLSLETIADISGELEAKFDEMYPKLLALKDEIPVKVDEAIDKMADECEAFKRLSVSGLCPIGMLPTNLKNEIKDALRQDSDISAYASTLTNLNGAAPAFMHDIDVAVSANLDSRDLDNAKNKLAAAVQTAKTYFFTSKLKLDESVDEVYKYIRGANFMIQPLKARAEMLDGYRAILGKQSKKKLLKSHPRSTDNIRFLTSLRIDPSPYDPKCYNVPLKDGRVLVLTVPELVYLGLAEYTV